MLKQIIFNKKKVFILFVTLILFSCKDENIKIGENNFKNGNYEEAIKNFEIALVKYPNDKSIIKQISDTHIVLGDKYFNDKKLDKSIEEYNKSLILNPENKEINKKISNVHINLGDSFFNNEEFNRAFIEYTEALKIDLNNTLIQSKIDTSKKLIKVIENMNSFNDILNLNQINVGTYVELFVFQFNINKLIGYIENRNSNPFNDELNNIKEGFIYYEDYLKLKGRKQTLKGLVIYDAKKSSCLRYEVFFNCSISYRIYGTNSNGDLLKKVIVQKPKINPVGYSDYFLDGYEAYKNNNYQDAITKLNTAIRIERNLCRAHYWLAQTFEKMKKYEEAIQEYKETILIDSEDKSSIDSYFRLGLIYFYQNKYALAIDEFTKKILYSPYDSNSSYYNIGLSYIRIGNQEEGYKNFKKSCEEFRYKKACDFLANMKKKK